ncbi:riboflavin kinase [Ectobacillus funiculus]|uniref:riboflavin kinase n=1 Tax=Ectobacillus funiculus TaxID=137993 RepID=UPI00397BF28C
MNSIITSIHGKVISGKQVGRTIGFPTANLSILSDFPSLPHGVYGVIVNWEGTTFPGIMNIGIRPTFNDNPEVSYEVHILDFHKNIYHEKIHVDICFHVRNERFFKDISELVKQIHNDITYVRKRFSLTNESNQNTNNFVSA